MVDDVCVCMWLLQVKSLLFFLFRFHSASQSSIDFRRFGNGDESKREMSEANALRSTKGVRKVKHL